MSTRKRTDLWDIPSDDEENNNEAGYDSEAAEETKGKGNKPKSALRSLSHKRPSKRRKLSLTAVVDDSEDEEGDDDYERVSGDESIDSQPEDEHSEPDGSVNGADTAFDASSELIPAAATTTTASRSKITPSTDIKDTKSRSATPDRKKKSKKNKTGVIYLSSVPPYLKPSALKSLLQARGFGPVTKLFLTPTVSTSSSGTKRSNKRRMYGDGWVEFASKRTAKICAETLNAQKIGGKKGGWYYDDLWNMKYLRGFKWADLMEQVQRERREAEARRRIEDARARKEEKVFLAGVERGKVYEGIRKKREEKEKKADTADTTGVESKKVDKPRRVFKQNEVKDMTKKLAAKEAKVDADAQRVLAKIF